MSRHEEIKALWKNKLVKPIEAENFVCFCYEYRCPHRNYSLCEKNCENLGSRKDCPQGDCQMQLQHPEECKKQIRELQEKAGVKATHVVGEPVKVRRKRKR